MTDDEEDSMAELYQSLSHSKWDCQYHVIFVPKDLVTLCITSLAAASREESPEILLVGPASGEIIPVEGLFGAC
jgi:hypothetical protein